MLHTLIPGLCGSAPCSSFCHIFKAHLANDFQLRCNQRFDDCQRPVLLGSWQHLRLAGQRQHGVHVFVVVGPGEVPGVSLCKQVKFMGVRLLGLAMACKVFAPASRHELRFVNGMAGWDSASHCVAPLTSAAGLHLVPLARAWLHFSDTCLP